MALPNRVVAAYIPTTAYRKLKASMDLDLCWSLFRKFIGHQLFGPAYVTVPFITAADYFSQLFVFIKDQRPFSFNSILTALNICPPTYKIIGNLDYLVNTKLSTWTPEFDVSPWDIMDGLLLVPDFRIRLDSSAYFEDSKSIEMMVRKPRMRFVEVPDSMILHLHVNLLEDLKEAKHIYVITEVVYASYVRFTLRVGNFEKFIVYERDIPIGMKYRKFQLGRDGRILRELPTRLRFGMKDVCWLRPETQPIPKILRHPDELNRERKNRTVLTVTASEADGTKHIIPKVTISQLQTPDIDEREVNQENNLGPNLRELSEDDNDRDNSHGTAVDVFSPAPSLISDAT